MKSHLYLFLQNFKIFHNSLSILWQGTLLLVRDIMNVCLIEKCITYLNVHTKLCVFCFTRIEVLYSVVKKITNIYIPQNIPDWGENVQLNIVNILIPSSKIKYDLPNQEDHELISQRTYTINISSLHKLQKKSHIFLM